MTTRLRTWVLIAGLSALFVSLGAFVGGTGGLIVFLLIAVGFNFAMYWFSDRIALKVSRAQPLERSPHPRSTPTSRISRSGPGYRCRGST